jgi:hypothetical protein
MFSNKKISTLAILESGCKIIPISEQKLRRQISTKSIKISPRLKLSYVKLIIIKLYF